MESLTSAQNPRVKAWAALKERKYRERDGLYLVEGARAVETYVERGAKIDAVLFDPYGERAESLLPVVNLCEKAGVRVVEVSMNVLAHVADTEHPQGIAAIVEMPEVTAEDVVSHATVGANAVSEPHCGDVLILADGIRDPGNLGTLLRSAQAVGVWGVLLGDGTVDAYNPKVVRAAMGALATLPVAKAGTDEAIELLARAGCRVIAADAQQGASLYGEDLRGRVAFVIGGETEGLSDAARSAAERVIALPMPGGAESLNAGVALSVILYEALRQRL